MNIHLRALVLASVLALWASNALAQPTVMLIPDEHKKQPESIPPASAKIIDNIVNTYTTNLLKGAPDVQARARQSLIAETHLADGKTDASPAFLNYYCQQVAKALTPALSGNDARQRLNAAIVISQLAENGSPLQLQACIKQMIARNQKPAVALWGVKAAGILYTWTQKMGQPQSQLLKDIRTAAETMGSTAIVQEAYKVFLSDPPDPARTPELFGLMNFRRNQFVAGAGDEPALESSTLTFLCAKIWSKLSPKEQLQTVQLLSDFISLMAEQATKVSPEKFSLYLLAEKELGSCLVVLSHQNGSAELAKAAGPLSKLNVISTDVNLPDMAQPIYPALKSVKGWENLTPPPAIKAATASN